MEVFITKYASTKGIFKEIVEPCSKANPDMVETCDRWHTFYHKNEWFHTYDEAKKDAERRVQATLKFLKNRIQKLEKLSF